MAQPQVLEDGKVGREEMSEKFKEILKSNGITDSVSEVIIEDAGLRGEGFSSLTQYVTIKFEDPAKKPLNLFAKVQTGNPAHNMMLMQMKAFEKEAMFLTKYLTAAKEMCQLKGYPELMDFYPKCYYGDSKMIVLENLVLDKGYQLIDKEQRQNLEDAKFAVKSLAKHHAIGHAMIMENGGAENFFQKFPDLNFESHDNPMMTHMLENAFGNSLSSNVKILGRNEDVSGAKETAEKLMKLAEDKPMSQVVDAVKTKDSSFLVLCHGDYWTNNMMYLKDKQTNKILHHVAIDFQVTRYNTPALDLGYYFFTSVQPHVRRSHLLELLTLYKDTLNEVTELLGHPTNLSVDHIYGEFRRKIRFGFWTGFVMTVGPGMGVFKDIDMGAVKLEELPAIMEQVLSKWIDENPVKVKKIAEELVKLVKEFEELKF